VHAYILIVDDDDDVREMLGEVLEEGGYRVASAEDGREALRYLSAHPPPFLIILDLMMPVMDGWQFLHEQRKSPALASIPVAVFSADPQVEHLDCALRVKKPADLDRIFELIEPFARQAGA
jgi:two-component system, chemotaxis family, chemotaxis protein CheY